MKIKPELIGAGLLGMPPFGDAAASPSGFNWYVDSVSGNDANTGKSAAQAFATITKLATVWAAGESVGLAKGSTWREQMTVPGNSCAIAAYGTGARPILDCSDVISAGWSKTVGQTNIYQVTLTTNYVASEPSFTSVWEDSVRLPIVASLATLDTTPGAYYCADHNTTTPIVYVHATDSGNPASNGSTYEMPVRISGVYGFSVEYTKLIGIQCRRNYSLGGSIKLGKYATVMDCLAVDGTSHNIYTRTGSTLTNVTATDAYYTANLTLFVHNENTPAGEGVTYTSCTAQMTTYGSAGVTVTGFYGHNNTSGSFGTVTISGCAAINCNIAATGQECDLFYIASLTATDCNECIRSTGVAVTVDSLIVVGGGGTSNRIINVISGAGAITVTGLDLSAADMDSSLVINSGQTNVCTFTGIDFTALSYTGLNRIFSLTNAGAKLIANNNTYPASGWTTVYFTNNLANDADHFISDFNAFGDDSQDIRLAGVTYSSVATYQAATGQDANSTVG